MLRLRLRLGLRLRRGLGLTRRLTLNQRVRLKLRLRLRRFNPPPTSSYHPEGGLIGNLQLFQNNAANEKIKTFPKQRLTPETQLRHDYEILGQQVMP